MAFFYKEDKVKIDNNTNPNAGQVWAEDWNIIIDNITKAKGLGDDNTKSLLYNLTKHFDVPSKSSSVTTNPTMDGTILIYTPTGTGTGTMMVDVNGTPKPLLRNGNPVDRSELTPDVPLLITLDANGNPTLPPVAKHPIDITSKDIVIDSTRYIPLNIPVTKDKYNAFTTYENGMIVFIKSDGVLSSFTYGGNVKTTFTTGTYYDATLGFVPNVDAVVYMVIYPASKAKITPVITIKSGTPPKTISPTQHPSAIETKRWSDTTPNVPKPDYLNLGMFNKVLDDLPNNVFTTRPDGTLLINGTENCTDVNAMKAGNTIPNDLLDLLKGNEANLGVTVPRHGSTTKTYTSDNSVDDNHVATRASVDALGYSLTTVVTQPVLAKNNTDYHIGHGDTDGTISFKTLDGTQHSIGIPASTMLPTYTYKSAKIEGINQFTVDAKEPFMNLGLNVGGNTQFMVAMIPSKTTIVPVTNKKPMRTNVSSTTVADSGGNGSDGTVKVVPTQSFDYNGLMKNRLPEARAQLQHFDIGEYSLTFGYYGNRFDTKPAKELFNNQTLGVDKPDILSTVKNEPNTHRPDMDNLGRRNVFLDEDGTFYIRGVGKSSAFNYGFIQLFEVYDINKAHESDDVKLRKEAKAVVGITTDGCAYTAELIRGATGVIDIGEFIFIRKISKNTYSKCLLDSGTSVVLLDYYGSGYSVSTFVWDNGLSMQHSVFHEINILCYSEGEYLNITDRNKTYYFAKDTLTYGRRQYKIDTSIAQLAVQSNTETHKGLHCLTFGSVYRAMITRNRVFKQATVDKRPVIRFKVQKGINKYDLNTIESSRLPYVCNVAYLASNPLYTDNTLSPVKNFTVPIDQTIFDTFITDDGFSSVLTYKKNSIIKYGQPMNVGTIPYNGVDINVSNLMGSPAFIYPRVTGMPTNNSRCLFMLDYYGSPGDYERNKFNANLNIRDIGTTFSVEEFVPYGKVINGNTPKTLTEFYKEDYINSNEISVDNGTRAFRPNLPNGSVPYGESVLAVKPFKKPLDIFNPYILSQVIYSTLPMPHNTFLSPDGYTYTYDGVDLIRGYRIEPNVEITELYMTKHFAVYKARDGFYIVYEDSSTVKVTGLIDTDFDINNSRVILSADLNKLCVIANDGLGVFVLTVNYTAQTFTTNKITNPANDINNMLAIPNPHIVMFEMGGVIYWHETLIGKRFEVGKVIVPTFHTIGYSKTHKSAVALDDFNNGSIYTVENGTNTVKSYVLNTVSTGVYTQCRYSFMIGSEVILFNVDSTVKVLKKDDTITNLLHDDGSTVTWSGVKPSMTVTSDDGDVIIVFKTNTDKIQRIDFKNISIDSNGNTSYVKQSHYLTEPAKPDYKHIDPFCSNVFFKDNKCYFGGSPTPVTIKEIAKIKPFTNGAILQTINGSYVLPTMVYIPYVVTPIDGTLTSFVINKRLRKDNTLEIGSDKHLTDILGSAYNSSNNADLDITKSVKFDEILSSGDSETPITDGVYLSRGLVIKRDTILPTPSEVTDVVVTDSKEIGLIQSTGSTTGIKPYDDTVVKLTFTKPPM